MRKLSRVFGKKTQGTNSDPLQTMPVRLQVMSDLHLETPTSFPMYTQFQVSPEAENLALLGDIGAVTDDRLFEFLEAQLRHFQVVFFLFGNHEPYAEDQWTWDEAVKSMEAFETEIATRSRQPVEDGGVALGRFVFLTRTRFDISPSVTVLGCTLFSQIRPEQVSTIQLFVSDFSNIAEWSIDTHNSSHQRDLQWLNDQVTSISQHSPHRRILILTHHSPTLHPSANDPEHLQDSRNVGSAFITDLSEESCWKSKNVKVWAFGHTHFNCDFVDSLTGKRVIANQRGYGREDLYSFDPTKTVSI